MNNPNANKRASNSNSSFLVNDDPSQVTTFIYECLETESTALDTVFASLFEQLTEAEKQNDT